jgi:hypothetical protein
VAEWQPPDPDDRAYFLAMARRNRALAAVAVVIGVVALAFCLPALPRALSTESPGYYVIGDAKGPGTT